MATPVIAGSAILVRQYFTDGYYPTGQKIAADAFTPSSALIKAVMISGVLLAQRTLRCDVLVWECVVRGRHGSQHCMHAELQELLSHAANLLAATGASSIQGVEADTGLPIDPPPSFRQGFGRVNLGEREVCGCLQRLWVTMLVAGSCGQWGAYG